jgi:glycosyltransferase involved in cell wall biosynthesis
MPRVLRIINRLNLGGPTFNAAYLTRYLPPEFETMLVSGMKDETEMSSEFIVKDLDLHPVYVPEMYRELNPMRDYKAFFKIRKIIQDFKPHIVHTHAAKPGAVGRFAAWTCGVPVILHTFHGHVFHSYFSPAKTRVFIEIERALARMSTRLIALSELQKKELVEDFKIAPASKFEIVSLGFDLNKFAADKESKRAAFRKKYNIAEDEVAIGIVGRLVPVKNHDLFLEAVKWVSERSKTKIRAFIIGDGEERPRLEALAKSLNLPFNSDHPELPNTLSFTSWIKEIDVSNAGMDIIALTSHNEGTPVSLIEAQASGKPMVSTNVGGIENIVLSGKSALLSPPGDVLAFAQNLLQLVDQPSLREQMAHTGTDYVMENFSYQRLCRDMAALYHRLLEEKKVKL